VAARYSAENGYWVFLHQLYFLHTACSKTEREEGKERRKKEKRRARKKERSEKGRFLRVTAAAKICLFFSEYTEACCERPNPNS
jgi:hypothetical protein